MSIFVIPTHLCEELERMINSFWWGKSGQNSRGLKWKNWNKLCIRKEEGGLGFRKLHDFNLAMIAKQSWNLLSNPNSLASCVIKARYYPQGNFLSARKGNNPSYAWRSLMSTQNLIRCGARIRVGSGKNTSIWNDPWLPDKSNHLLETRVYPHLASAKVKSLRISDNGGWDIDMVKDLFSERDQKLVLSVPLSHFEREDEWMWDEGKNGKYSVKSGYKVIRSMKNDHPISTPINWKLIWKLKVQGKIRIFLWRALSSCLPTLTALQGRRVEVVE